jgi:hypothetical protein
VPPFKETKNYVKKITGSTAPPAPLPVVYRWFELVNGKPSVRYSNKPPASGSYEVIDGRRP